MYPKQFLLALLAASSTVTSALPTDVNLEVCARNDQSASCLKARAMTARDVDVQACARADQSASCLKAREAAPEIDIQACARSDQSASCLKARAAYAAATYSGQGNPSEGY